jgi:predicted ATP-grasp superfamily ATP-dependent carboligase
MNTSVPAVVLAPGYYVAHIVARSLGRLGVPMYGVHGDARSPAARSRFWRENLVWRFDTEKPEGSIDWLLALARRIGDRPVLIPTDDVTCVFASTHDAALRAAFRMPAHRPGLATTLLSKRELHELCRRLAIPTAHAVFPRSPEDVREFASTATFPVMLKPIENHRAEQRRSDRQKVVIPDGATLLRRYGDMETPESPNFMLQEFIPGDASGVWMFNGYFDSASRCLFGMAANKIRQFPPATGVTSLGVCQPNAEVTRLTLRLAQAVGYSGIVDLDYKHDPRTGEYKLLDFNPRLGATFRLFVDTADMDVVRTMYLDLTGQPIVTGAPRHGRKWVVEDFDVASSLSLIRRRELSPAAWVRSWRGIGEASWLAFDDPRPFAAMAWRAITRHAGQ